MNAKKIIVLIILLCLSWQLAYSDNAGKIYRVAGDIQFPPYEYLDTDGIYKGFNVDLLKAISLVTGMTFEFMPMKWEDAFHAIERDEADIIQGMKESEARKSKFNFTSSLLLNSQSIFVKDNYYAINSNTDLAGKTVSVLKEDIVFYELSKIKEITILQYDTIEEAVEALFNNEVEAMVGNTLTVNFICKEKGWIEQVKIVGETLNEGLGIIQRNGMYDTLHRKWFGTPIKNINAEKVAQIRLLLLISFVLSLIVLSAHFFNRKLKAIIEEKTREEKMLINELRNYDKLQFMDKIISSLAHEIRNPLTSVKLYTTQMKSKLDNQAFMLAAAQDIPEEINRIDDLIKEFMEYTTPRKPHMKALNLKTELDNTVKFIKLQIKDIFIDIHVPGHMLIAFDSSHFKQIVINILLNCKDALTETLQPQIKITGSESADGVNIEFSDNGCGMDNASLSYIFEPFYTTKDHGNGVGMFIVKKLVEENGGKITATNNESASGLTVSLTLCKGAHDEA